MSDFADHDVTGLNNKLQAFSATLTPGQQQIFGGLMNAARENLSTSDVHGYDGGGNTDLLTKINWDALSTMSATPNPIGDRNLGGGNQ